MHIEITVRDLQVLPKIIENLKIIKPNHINLTDKTGILDNVEAAAVLKAEFPESKITTHYSLKNHTSRTAILIVEKFEDHFSRAIEAGVDEILIISGSQKPSFDSLKALEYINENLLDTLESSKINIAVAYNPFLEGKRLEDENSRLFEKLKYNFVKTVYFQIGSVYRPIVVAKELIDSLSSNVKIIPSLPIPTETFLKKFRFKPWKDVYLDEKYLSNLKNSQAKTIELFDVMDQNDLHPVLELFEISKFDFDNLNAVIKL